MYIISGLQKSRSIKVEIYKKSRSKSQKNTSSHERVHIKEQKTKKQVYLLQPI